jgi:hypothetical protein
MSTTPRTVLHHGFGTHHLMTWFSPWAWDAQRHTYRATSPQTPGGCAPVRIMPIHLRNRVSLSIKPLTCQGGVGDRLLSPTGRESRGRGLPLPFGAVRHLLNPQPKSPKLSFTFATTQADLQEKVRSAQKGLATSQLVHRKPESPAWMSKQISFLQQDRSTNPSACHD